MQRRSFDDFSCSVAQTLEVIGEWWTPMIVRDLMLGVTRFDDFQSRLGIARNVLTTRLNHLVERGVVEKVAYQDRPVRYDYRLTDKGKDLWLVMTTLREWGDRWEAPDGPPVELVHRACGHVTHVVPTCSECGEVLERRGVRAQVGPGSPAGTELPPRRGRTGQPTA
ncbi:helix-turn-helix transcriptional regulator [Aquihabitans sp. G128]|uniref:winged helix-turn-helix transcriptional regulator n=1 Tax=Aquihabitans sp. G128 TaxID=2849779 RepID=UPI001C216E1F|nr:helix-turn-helix domain-containing protein [Aquihabitans sp. G128]QXC61266.1 helix-turn-helix transcriptional regulator [Aquihabitans sp. G128]QXC61317.1 helix-turn-helix transcriptional regulator [Aquihabitans sp. G128]